MCRYKTEEGERKIYGVLMDFDLSSWTEALKNDYTMTSQQRTGTPPYMAHEILLGKNCTHLYRHDLESLFFVMLLTATRHSIGIPEGKTELRLVMREEGGKKIEFKKLPFSNWFDQCNYHMLGSLKGSFFNHKESINLSPDFQDFQEWLVALQNRFTEGFADAYKSRPATQERQLPTWDNTKSTANRFDEETLGGYITYDAVVKVVPFLKGKLHGLDVPYHFPKPRRPRTRRAKRSSVF